MCLTFYHLLFFYLQQIELIPLTMADYFNNSKPCIYLCIDDFFIGSNLIAETNKDLNVDNSI